MNESAESPQPLFAPKWALRFGAALLAGLAIVVGLVCFDRFERARLESTSETTAVGDGKFFKPPPDAKALPVTAAALHGQPLAVASLEKIEVRDTHLRRVAVDAASGLTIYELSAAATDEERARVGADGKAYLLKLAPGDYVKARAAVP